MPCVLKQKTESNTSMESSRVEQMRHSVSLPNTEILPHSFADVTLLYFLKQTENERAGVKSAYCSCRGAGFSSPDPHGRKLTTITPCARTQCCLLASASTVHV